MSRVDPADLVEDHGRFADLDETRPSRPNVSAAPVCDGIAVYDPCTRSLVVLNPGAGAIWNRCDGETTVGQIARELCATHDAPLALVLRDTRATVGKLMDIGLLTPPGQVPADTA